MSYLLFNSYTLVMHKALKNLKVLRDDCAIQKSFFIIILILILKLCKEIQLKKLNENQI